MPHTSSWWALGKGVLFILGPMLGLNSDVFPKMHPSEIESGHFCLFSNTYRLADAGRYALQVRYFLLLYWFSVRNLSEPFKEQ